ncbi:barstar family protein [Longispora urticae]
MARTLLFDASTMPPEGWDRLDWLLLRESHVHRCADGATLDSAVAKLERLDYRVVRLAAGSWLDGADMHAALAAALDFPAYYGRNLDALNDVLWDVAAYGYGSDPAATGTVLALDGFEAFAIREPVVSEALLDIFANRARTALVMGHPMLCLVEAEMSFLPVGATPVPRWP